MSEVPLWAQVLVGLLLFLVGIPLSVVAVYYGLRSIALFGFAFVYLTAALAVVLGLPALTLWIAAQLGAAFAFHASKWALLGALSTDILYAAVAAVLAAALAFVQIALAIRCIPKMRARFDGLKASSRSPSAAILLFVSGATALVLALTWFYWHFRDWPPIFKAM